MQAFQRAQKPPLNDDGRVGKGTMTALDKRFATRSLPPAADLAAPWTEACVRSVLCPWSPRTVEVLKSRIKLKSFDSISWKDEKWDGKAWVVDPFPGGGYNTGKEIGLRNSTCEKIAQTLYHEVLHAEQPKSQTTTLEKESYAYRFGEEFSIALGFVGRSSLRSTNVLGREFADPAKVSSFVSTQYPSVPSGGGKEEVVSKGVKLGDVKVRKVDGSFYERAAAIGEKVPGPIKLVNEKNHDTSKWKCP